MSVMLCTATFVKINSCLVARIVPFDVKPKIGNREKHQRKHGKYPNKLGKQQVKHEETYGEMRE